MKCSNLTSTYSFLSFCCWSLLGKFSPTGKVSACRSAGGAMAPSFGQITEPYSNQGGRLCQPHYLWPSPFIFGLSAVSAACHFYIEEQLQFRLLSQFRPKIGPKPLWNGIWIPTQFFHDIFFKVSNLRIFFFKSGKKEIHVRFRKNYVFYSTFSIADASWKLFPFDKLHNRKFYCSTCFWSR